MYDWMHDLDMEENDVLVVEDVNDPECSLEMVYEPSALPPYPHSSTRKLPSEGKPPRKKIKRENRAKINKNNKSKENKETKKN